MLRIISIILVFISSAHVFASTYTRIHISEVLSQPKVNQETAQFIRGFFLSKQPQNYIEGFISNSRSVDNDLTTEYQLNALLNEISLMPKQAFLQNFIDTMKFYESTAMVRHDEGDMLVPVFNIQARAKGIENIWNAQNHMSQYIQKFVDEPQVALATLQKDLGSMSRPQWLGVKKSLDYLSAEKHQAIHNYLMTQVNDSSALDRFISHYALFSKNESLATKALTYLDQKNSEYLLRNLPLHFSQDYVVKQLTTSVQKRRHAAFAIDMMLPFVDTNQDIRQILLALLSRDDLNSKAAYVLSKTQDVELLYTLEQRYYDSESALERKNIIFAVKLNQLKESEKIINRLSKTVNDKATQSWLKSFAGGAQ